MQRRPTSSIVKSTLSLKEANTKENTQDTAALPLHLYVEAALNNYFVESKGQPVTELYNTLLSAVEPALLKITFKFCKTRSEAVKILGLSRGTLHKKLKQYHLNDKL